MWSLIVKISSVDPLLFFFGVCFKAIALKKEK